MIITYIRNIMAKLSCNDTHCSDNVFSEALRYNLNTNITVLFHARDRGFIADQTITGGRWRPDTLPTKDFPMRKKIIEPQQTS